MYCSHCGKDAWVETPEGVKCMSCNHLLENAPPVSPDKDKKVTNPVLRTIAIVISGIIIVAALVSGFLPSYSAEEKEKIDALNERIEQVVDTTDLDTVTSILTDYSALEEERLTRPIKMKKIYQYFNNFAESILAENSTPLSKNKVWGEYIYFCKMIPENKLSKQNKNFISENGEFFDELYELEVAYQQAIKIGNPNNFSDLGTYRASKELYSYFYYTNKNYNIKGSAEYELKARLKDPSSYQYISSTKPTATISKKDDNTATITKTCTITYSATNSFGARVKDSYYYSNKIEVSLFGMDYDKASDIFCSSLENVIKKYDK